MHKTRLWKESGNLLAARIATPAAIALGCAVLFGQGPALATPNVGFASSMIGPTTFGDIDIKLHTDSLKIKMQTQGFSDVYVVTNTVAVGGHSGWHTHSGPSLVSVKSGTATYYEGDDPKCTPHVILQGEGFVDSGDGHVHLIRNEGAEVLELVAFQMIPEGAVRRIDAPRPGNCPF